jgi:hypothetical protein
VRQENSGDTIGNRDRDLPDGKAVYQPIAPPRALSMKGKPSKNKEYFLLLLSVKSLQYIKNTALR